MAFPTGFSPIESVPGKSEWGLDTLRRSFKTGYAADTAILDTFSPAKYTTDSANGGIHTQMFLTDKTVSESSANASRLDLVYTGLLNGSVLPPGQHKVNSVLQTSQSPIRSIPVWMTVQIPQNEFTWISSTEGAGAPITNTAGGGGLNAYRIPGTVTVTNNGTQLQNLAGFG